MIAPVAFMLIYSAGVYVAGSVRELLVYFICGLKGYIQVSSYGQILVGKQTAVSA